MHHAVAGPILRIRNAATGAPARAPIAFGKCGAGALMLSGLFALMQILTLHRRARQPLIEVNQDAHCRSAVVPGSDRARDKHVQD